MTTCKRWVLPASRSFTGGCSMRMLSDSSEPECSICVIPVDVAGPSPGTVIDPSCKQWEISKDLFSPLCTNQFLPVEGNFDCGICVSPVEFNSSCSNCESAPEEFTFTNEGMYWFFPGLATQVIYRMPVEDWNTYNVKRVSKCGWQSDAMHLMTVIASNPSDLLPLDTYKLYCRKFFGIASPTSNPSNTVQILGAWWEWWTEPATIYTGKVEFTVPQFTTPVAGVCYPRVFRNNNPRSVSGGVLVWGGFLTVEPV